MVDKDKEGNKVSKAEAVWVVIEITFQQGMKDKMIRMTIIHNKIDKEEFKIILRKVKTFRVSNQGDLNKDSIKECHKIRPKCKVFHLEMMTEKICRKCFVEEYKISEEEHKFAFNFCKLDSAVMETNVNSLMENKRNKI